MMAVAFSLAAPFVRAQSARIRRVGILTGYTLPNPPQKHPDFGVFIDAMAELGYVSGKTVSYEWRGADGRFDRLPGLAAELVASGVEVIVAQSTPGVRAAKRATKTIPIAFVGAGDPVGTGLIDSLARPGGNATGVANLSVALDGKRVELLKEAIAGLGKVGVLLNSANPTYSLHVKQFNEAGERHGVRIVILPARTAEEIDKAFETLRQERANALIVQVDTFFFQRSRQIATLAIAARLPTMFGGGSYVEAGGLMSYAHRQSDQYRKVAEYVDKILNGANPATLPVDQPTRVELVVNTGTAKAIGIKLPPTIVNRADRVIE